MTHQTVMKSRMSPELVRSVHLESKSAGGVQVRRYELSKHGRELLTSDVQEVPNGKSDIKKKELYDRIYHFFTSVA